MGFWDNLKRNLAATPEFGGLFADKSTCVQEKPENELVKRLHALEGKPCTEATIAEAWALYEDMGKDLSPNCRQMRQFKKDIEAMEDQLEQKKLEAREQGRLVFPILSKEERHRLLIDPNPPNMLDGIVGNENAKANVKYGLYHALGNKYHCVPANYAFYGPASSGKTHFSRHIAKILGLPHVEISCPALERIHPIVKRNGDAPCTLLGEVVKVLAAFQPNSGSYPQPEGIEGADSLEMLEKGGIIKLPPMVIFLDEIHAAKKEIQQALLKATEPSDRRMVTEGGFDVDCSDVYWHIATTHRKRVFRPLRTRFEDIEMSLYTQDEIATILQINFDLEPEVCKLFAHYCGRVPREANRFAQKALEIQKATPNTWEAIAAQTAELKNIDQYGMHYKRLRILETLGRGPCSKSTLAANLGCEEEELDDEWLPYLKESTRDRESLVVMTNRCYITEAGIAELDKRNLPHQNEEMILSKR
jgi:Holliday junction resolvasome RuvABC ATP-dependent DNA helicase subunit